MVAPIISATRDDAYQLLHDGALAMVEFEERGLRLDVGYCKTKMAEVTDRIESIKREMEKTDEVKFWKRKYGSRFNLDSSDQIGDILFNELGFKSERLTAAGDLSTDKEALKYVKHPLAKKIVEIRKLNKITDTYLSGLIREAVDGIVHPFFHLNIARTYRSSSSNPNSQNFPVRDEEMMQIIRGAIIPWNGWQLMEIDINGAEIRGGCCYHHDRQMIKYVLDKTLDMHRDLAMECYRLSAGEITKNIRYCGKNKFIFPQFYGDYWKTCAKALWDAIEFMGLKTKSGIPLMDHLRTHGISSLGDQVQGKPAPGTFCHHIMEVERDFWGRRFREYDQWRDDFYNEYLDRGYIESLTGFRFSGLMSRNDVTNYPIQGTAFHWLLWTCIQLVKELKKYKFKSFGIAQIHDSVLLNVVPNEAADIYNIVREIMSVRLPKHWPWIATPIESEAEISPIDESWAMKKAFNPAA